MQGRTPIDITGQKHGRLTALTVSGKRGKEYLWTFVCDCGLEVERYKSAVINGNTRSCGCLRDEKISQVNKSHSMRQTRFYRIWSSLKSRCNNDRTPTYRYYGARSIRCLWGSFQEFKKDMYPSYCLHVALFGEKETSIDRIDNDGNYCKENCRWATLVEQARNRRSNRIITFEDESKTVAAWAEEKGLKFPTLHKRLAKGWPVEKALTLLKKGANI